MQFHRIAIGIVTGASIIHCIGEYVADLTWLTGPSMLPTLNSQSSGDVVITELVTRKLHLLKRGDITIVRSPEDPTSSCCKRIAAMAGDLVSTGPDEDDYIKVPKGHVWLLGDNPDDSRDSRDYGPVPYGLITGRVCFKVWPLSEFGRIE